MPDIYCWSGTPIDACFSQRVQISGSFLSTISSVHARCPSTNRWLPWCWWAVDV
jgi:hypothetical protein